MEEKLDKKLTDFINAVYQNTQTAIKSIEDILNINKDEKFLAELLREKEGYLKIKNKVIEYSNSIGYFPDDNSWLEKARLYTSIKMTTIFDKSLRHLTEMMLLGTVMGTLTCYKDLTDYKDVDNKMYAILTELIAFEEECFNNLKGFLKVD